MLALYYHQKRMYFFCLTKFLKNNVKEINRKFDCGGIDLKSFQGAKSYQLYHYALPSFKVHQHGSAEKIAGLWFSRGESVPRLTLWTINASSISDNNDLHSQT